MTGDLSDSDSEDEENFVAENKPRLPPKKVLYNENGTTINWDDFVFEDRIMHQRC